MASPLIFRGFPVFFGIRPPNEILPVDTDGWKTALGYKPVDIGTGHASEFGGCADAYVLIRVDLWCHTQIVADRIPRSTGKTLSAVSSALGHAHAR